MQGRACFRPKTTLAVLAFVLVGLALGGGKAMAASSNAGAVYVQTNTPGNAVQVFHRSANGQLTAGAVVPTGGDGSTVNPPFGLAVTDSQNSVVLTQDHHILLVTNNASHTVSTFRVGSDGNITLAAQVDSGGTWPNSVAVSNVGGKSLVYVLNEVSETVTGFTLSETGHLSPIAGSSRDVSGLNSATIGFDSTGHVLTVTNRNNVFVNDPAAPGNPLTPPNGTISTFAVNPRSGLLSAHDTVTDATGTGAPFGFDYSASDQLVVADAGQLDVLNPGFPNSFGLLGGASSYDVSAPAGSVTPGTAVSSGGLITCWAKVTNDNQYAYFTNPGTAAISGFSIGDNSLEQVSSTFNGFSADPTHPLSPLDLDTAGAHYLYVLGTYIDVGAGFVFHESMVNGYRINGDGSLTPITSVPAGSGGNSGLASY